MQSGSPRIELQDPTSFILLVEDVILLFCDFHPILLQPHSLPSRVTEGKYCLCCGRAEAGAPAPAPYARQRYHHVAPDGERCVYSDADHALIACVPSQDVLLVI